MKINFYLRDEKKPKSSVQVLITHGGKVYRRQAGFSVRTDRWRKPKNGVQTSTDPKIADKLKEIRLNLEARLSAVSTPRDIVAALDEVVSEKPSGISKSAPTFWEFMHVWADREKPTMRQDKTVCRKVAEMMGDTDNWEDIDTAWFFRLQRKMEERGWSINYRGVVISRIKAVMNEALRMKYHANTDFRLVRKTMEKVDSVYLTQDEVDAVWNIDLRLSEERKSRDLFIIGVYTAARFSDYSRLSMDDIQNGFIHFVQKKTSGSVIIPASPRVIAILERNGGAAPKISQQKFNENIKSVCRKANIREIVTVTRSSGTKHITEKREKCDLVSSHTARRTGATLLYMSGVPLKQCMMITGHTTETSFMKYIRISKEENAESLASIPFFTRL